MSNQERADRSHGKGWAGRPATNVQTNYNVNNTLDLQGGRATLGHVGGARVVEIERVEIVREDGESDPMAAAGIERLLSQWLVRAYLARYGHGGGEQSRAA